MKMKNWKITAASILLAEGVGLLASLLTRDAMKLYEASIQKPALSPPGHVFPIAWGILYALMGIAAARIWLKPPSPQRSRSLWLYLLQLAFNFFWSILFFRFQAFGFAFLWLAVLWLLIVRTSLSFSELDRPAAWLMVPYLLWVLFAAYLNLGVWRLNGGASLLSGL